MSATFSRRRSHALAALAFAALSTLAAFASTAHAAQAAQSAQTASVPLLDELEQSVRAEGGFMKELTEEGIADVRRKLAAGETPSGVDYGLLISKLVEECQDEAVEHPDRALRKIALALKLADAWRDRFDNWDSIVRRNEATALMWRWLLLGQDADRQLAHRHHALNDETETIPKDRGMGAYFLGAEYEQLAMAAQKLGRPREAQVALLRQGLAVHQAGYARYRDGFDSTVGLNALYGKFQFVTGGSMLAEVMDEWLAALRDRSPQAQARSGTSVAGPLFLLGRDDEAVVWLKRYLRQDEAEDAAQIAALAGLPDAPPDARAQVQAMRREGRCMTVIHTSEFQAFSHRAPRRAAEVRDLACAGVSPGDSPNVSRAMSQLGRAD